ncbi:hypothetical protein KGF56_000469 [Candida oxycetoniae]|uniref:Uncharacterized protein n=1 Tax=Candida oxycetoniae TaxID=497107 RepID=A0AAI9WZW2_9ASCO|nr:uncharacterized protein KGF56_000469 [Candida oxycetoniae]KAI3406623.2 hypothetical protein KGF56_000469 [Candida oxycetoniae]
MSLCIQQKEGTNFQFLSPSFAIEQGNKKLKSIGHQVSNQTIKDINVSRHYFIKRPKKVDIKVDGTPLENNLHNRPQSTLVRLYHTANFESRERIKKQAGEYWSMGKLQSEIREMHDPYTFSSILHEMKKKEMEREREMEKKNASDIEEGEVEIDKSTNCYSLSENEVVDQINLEGDVDQINLEGDVDQINLEGEMDQINLEGEMDQVNLEGEMDQVNLKDVASRDDLEKCYSREITFGKRERLKQEIDKWIKIIHSEKSHTLKHEGNILEEEFVSDSIADGKNDEYYDIETSHVGKRAKLKQKVDTIGKWVFYHGLASSPSTTSGLSNREESYNDALLEIGSSDIKSGNGALLEIGSSDIESVDANTTKSD